MEKTLLKHAYVWNSDQTFTEDAWILIAGEKIIDIGTGEYTKDTSSVDVLDMHHQYIIPGLLNAHTHIFMAPKDPSALSRKPNIVEATHQAFQNLDALLHSGVTYFRDVGCPLGLDLQLRDLLQAGKLFGPEAIVSSTPLVMTGGHVHQIGVEVDGEQEVRKEARNILKNGADCVKVMATGGVSTDGETPHDVQLNEAEIRAAVEEAHHKHKTVAAHAQGTRGIKNALRAGVDSIEHGIFLDDEAINLFLENDAFMVPTLMAPKAIIDYGTEAGIPAFMVEKSKSVLEAHQESVLKAYKTGVKLVMGTDAGTPFNLFDKSPAEMNLMVDCGMSEAAVIQSATKSAAELMQVADTHGTIAKGMTADMVVLNGNPLEDIGELERVVQVFKKGVSVKQN